MLRLRNGEIECDFFVTKVYVENKQTEWKGEEGVWCWIAKINKSAKFYCLENIQSLSSSINFYIMFLDEIHKIIQKFMTQNRPNNSKHLYTMLYQFYT